MSTNNNNAKISLMLGTLAFQIHVVTMARESDLFSRFVGGLLEFSQGQTVEAFTVLALILLAAALVLLAQITFVELQKFVKLIACICAVVTLWGGALFVLIAIIVFGAKFGREEAAFVPYEYTTHVTSCLAAIVSGAFVIRVILSDV